MKRELRPGCEARRVFVTKLVTKDGRVRRVVKKIIPVRVDPYHEAAEMLLKYAVTNAHPAFARILGARMVKRNDDYELHIIQEYVPGKQLQHIPSRVKRKMKRITEWAANKGITLYDVSPFNLIRLGRRVKIVDFMASKKYDRDELLRAFTLLRKGIYAEEIHYPRRVLRKI